MAPLTPHWKQPSHPSIQTVVFSGKKEEFTSKSLSKVSLPPFAVYAKLEFPPCTKAEEATYATVQIGKNEHLNLNSDLVYINHSCEPSVIFDIPTLSILAGPNGLKADQELTFFYPSTEWDMAQGFTCFCGSKDCRGYIDGAGNMSPESLKGMWLNGWIREGLEERERIKEVNSNGNGGTKNGNGNSEINGKNGEKNGKGAEEGKEVNGKSNGDGRRGVTSRELSGEMGGDTKSEV